MLEILLVHGTLDAMDNIIQLEPPTFTDDLDDYLKVCGSTKEMSRCIQNTLNTRLNGPDGSSWGFIIQAGYMLVIGHALWVYFLGSQFMSPQMHLSLDSYKSSFNIFCLTPPPLTPTSEYNEHVKSYTTHNADSLLEQPEIRQSTVERKNFISGRQKVINDFFSTIGNIFVFARCFVKFDMADESTYPLLLHRLSKLVSLIVYTQFRKLMDTHITTAPWIPHHLLHFVQSYFQSITGLATTPALLRLVLTNSGSDKYLVKDFKASENLFKLFYDNLTSAMVCNNLGVLQSPPLSYELFFPKSKTKSKQSVENQSTTEVTKKLGSLIVSGNHDVRLPFDKLTERYCSFFSSRKM